MQCFNPKPFDVHAAAIQSSKYFCIVNCITTANQCTLEDDHLTVHSVDVSNFGRKKCDSVLTLDLSSMDPMDSGNMPQTSGEQWLFEI